MVMQVADSKDGSWEFRLAAKLVAQKALLQANEMVFALAAELVVWKA